MALREASFKGAAFHVEETSGQFGCHTVKTWAGRHDVLI